MSRARTPHDPLRGRNWRDGIEPPATQQQPVQQQQEPPESDWDPFSKRAVMARRAASIIRRKYGIESGDMRRMAQHDNETRRIWNQLMDGTYQPPSRAQIPSAEYEAARRAMDPRNWR